jgi:DNA-binding XRE family transcriptional regulator
MPGAFRHLRVREFAQKGFILLRPRLPNGVAGRTSQLVSARTHGRKGPANPNRQIFVGDKAMCSEIAQLLKKERLRRKLSLNLISSKAGLSRQTVSFIEREERTPTLDTLLRLTVVLEIKLEALIRRARKQALAKSLR